MGAFTGTLVFSQASHLTLSGGSLQGDPGVLRYEGDLLFSLASSSSQVRPTGLSLPSLPWLS